MAINTAVRLSILGGYSHFPISLSGAQQTDRHPDKHNHSQPRFSEHLSLGNNVEKTQVNTLFLVRTHNSEPQIILCCDYYVKVLVIGNFDRKLCIDTRFHKYATACFICKLINSKRTIYATWIEWIFMLRVLHENMELGKGLMSLKFGLVIKNPLKSFSDAQPAETCKRHHKFT